MMPAAGTQAVPLSGLDAPLLFQLKNMIPPKELEKVCVEAAKAGGAVALAYFKKEYAVRYKNATRDGSSIATEADVACEKEIITTIKKHFPEHNIIAEECGGAEKSGYSWIIDPIDGTMNFSRGWDMWGVSVGVVLDGKPIAGAIYQPKLDKLFQASQGNGALLNNTKIRTSEKTLKDAIACLASGFSMEKEQQYFRLISALRPHVAGLRTIGSATFIFSLVAEGCADIAIVTEHKPWDICAAAIIIKEAGGVATNLSGEEWTANDCNLIAAANKELYGDVRKLLKKIYENPA